MASGSHNCPSGFQYYVCRSNGFVGCCSIDPCTSSGCPENDSNGNPDTDVATSREGSISVDPTPSSVASSSSSTLSQTPTPSAAASRSTNFDIATLLVPTSAASTSDDRVTLLITSVRFVSQEVVTPTSDGFAMQPTNSAVTSTVISTFSTPTSHGSARPSTPASATVGANAPSASTDAPAPPAPNADTHTAAIAGSVGGFAGLIIAAILISLLLRWQKSKREKDVRAIQHDDDPRLQGIDANRAGSAFKDDEGPPPYAGDNHGGRSSHWTADPTRSSPVSPLSNTIHYTTTTNAAHQSNDPYNHINPDATDLLHDSANHKAELSGEGAPSLSELSPTPERSPINAPRRAAVPAFDDLRGQAEGSPPADSPAMQPSLDSSMRSSHNESGSMNGQRQHIMSWMNYDRANPSPAR